MTNLKGNFPDGKNFAMGKETISIRGVDAGAAVHGRRCSYPVKHDTISLMDQKWGTGFLFHEAVPANMVKMTMGIQYHLDMIAGIVYGLPYSGCIVARINNRHALG
jgi:hypothetical protein